MIAYLYSYSFWLTHIKELEIWFVKNKICNLPNKIYLYNNVASNTKVATKISSSASEEYTSTCIWEHSSKFILRGY